MKNQELYHAMSRYVTSDEMRIELAALAAELSYIAFYFTSKHEERLLAESIAKVEVMIERYRRCAWIGKNSLLN